MSFLQSLKIFQPGLAGVGVHIQDLFRRIDEDAAAFLRA